MKKVAALGILTSLFSFMAVTLQFFILAQVTQLKTYSGGETVILDLSSPFVLSIMSLTSETQSVVLWSNVIILSGLIAQVIFYIRAKRYPNLEQVK